MTVTVEQILNGARKWLNFKEGKNNDNPFGKHFRANNQAYCAYFISYVLIVECKMNIFPCGYVPTLFNYYKGKGKIYSQPKVGDLVFFDFVKDGISEHIGFVEQVLPNGKIITIEANTSSTHKGSQDNGDGVFRKERYISSCLGFGRIVT